jgi:DNA repair protein RadD
MITYRDYQEFAIASIFEYFEEGGQGHPIVAMPTGTGKSVVIGGFVKEALSRFPGSRIIKLTHVKELIEQNFEKLLALWPTAPAGICSAGLNRKDTQYPITFAGIATVVKIAERFGRIDLLLIDECHLVSPNANTMYRAFINALLEINPYLKVIGFTATKYRLGQGMLVEEGGIFTDVCCDMTTMEGFNWFVSEGYLCPLIPKRTAMALETDGVKVQGGEFVLKQLQECVDKAEITYAALQEAQSLAYDRKHWLIFASGIEHTEHIASMLDSLNIPATFIHSKIPKAQRDARINAFRNGEVQAMVNNGILTTGFDYPDIDLIIMLRPTQSPGLWVQMLGRGTRPSYADGFDLSTTEGRLAAIQNSEKKNCLVLDFARNTKRLGPINDPVLPRRKGKGGGSAPVRICEECGTYCHASLRVCPHCGIEFPMSVKFGVHAGEEELIAKDEPQVETFKVDRVVYSEHQKQDKPPTIKVSYYCGLRIFNEWVCLEHEGYPRKKSRDWWRDRAQDDFPPETTSEALGLIKDLRTPTFIRVWINKKYPEILSYEY